MTKQDFIKTMLLYHKAVTDKTPQETVNMLVNVWNFDLEKYSLEELKPAWTEYRKQEDFLSLAKFIQILERPKNASLVASVEKEVQCAINWIIGGGRGEISNEVTRYVLEKVETLAMWRDRSENEFMTWFPKRFKEAYLEALKPEAMVHVKNWLENKDEDGILDAVSQLKMELK